MPVLTKPIAYGPDDKPLVIKSANIAISPTCLLVRLKPSGYNEYRCLYNSLQRRTIFICLCSLDTLWWHLNKGPLGALGSFVRGSHRSPVTGIFPSQTASNAALLFYLVGWTNCWTRIWVVGNWGRIDAHIPSLLCNRPCSDISAGSTPYPIIKCNAVGTRYMPFRLCQSRLWYSMWMHL